MFSSYIFYSSHVHLLYLLFFSCSPHISSILLMFSSYIFYSSHVLLLYLLFFLCSPPISSILLIFSSSPPISSIFLMFSSYIFYSSHVLLLYLLFFSCSPPISSQIFILESFNLLHPILPCSNTSFKYNCSNLNSYKLRDNRYILEISVLIVNLLIFSSLSQLKPFPKPLPPNRSVLHTILILNLSSKGSVCSRKMKGGMGSRRKILDGDRY